MLKITFSWDDGSKKDLKLADLSEKYEIPAMFFIPCMNPEREVLTGKEISLLFSSGFQIGSHTRSHNYLTSLSLGDAGDEMVAGKKYLQDITKAEIDHFCFPGGKYNKQILDLAKNLFNSARTADTCVTKRGTFLIKPTFHFYNRGVNSLIYNSLKNDQRLLKYVLKSKLNADYFDIIKSIIRDFARNESDGNIMIWGHSWEIDQFDLWPKLESFFQYMSSNFKENLCSYDSFIGKG